jgi:hypothetical protein
MLGLLDVAIGFAAIMLAVSLIIMSLTQAISSSLALRGARLRTGLRHLIEQTAPSIKHHAEEISREMVAHRLVSDTATVLPGRWQWATVIKKEELMPVLDAVLKSRQLTLADVNERAAIEQWFDSFMTRISQWFAMNTRWITVALAVVLTFTMHLDSAQVLRQLQEDVTSAGISFPPQGHTPADWLAVTSPHFWGMLTSVLFLSLGAPFWFNLLKNMASLKSAVAIRMPGDGNGDVPEERVAAGPPSGRAARLPAIPQPAEIDQASAGKAAPAKSRRSPPHP